MVRAHHLRAPSMRHTIGWLVVLVVLGACDRRAPASSGPEPRPATPAASSHAKAAVAIVTPPPSDASPAFVDTVWRVQPGSGVEAGTTYTFLRDGTLRIEAPHGTPAQGQWRYADGKLTMIEEGIAYPIDIVSLDATRFVLRSHNPGGAVDIAMRADAGARVPQAH